MLFPDMRFKFFPAYPVVAKRTGESDTGLIRLGLIHPQWFRSFHFQSSFMPEGRRDYPKAASVAG
jgi:hypothetical protein